MNTKEKRTYLLIASEEGYQKLIVTIEKILSKQNNTYVHAYFMFETKNNNLCKLLCELRTKYYDRLILKDTKSRQGFLGISQLLKTNNIFENELISFINGYKGCANEELYVLIGNVISIEKFKKVLGNHIGKLSQVIYETIDK